MPQNELQKKSPGRPRQFDIDEALDRAVLMFWQHGFASVDTQTLAEGMGLTKPSVYRAFGDKHTLFMRALERYGKTIGSEALIELKSAHSIHQGINAFFNTLAKNHSGIRGARGCLFACVASQCAESKSDVRNFLASGLQATDNAICLSFDDAVKSGELPSDFPVENRGRITTDLMQAMAMRARAGASYRALQELAKANAKFVLQ